MEAVMFNQEYGRRAPGYLAAEQRQAMHQWWQAVAPQLAALMQASRAFDPQDTADRVTQTLLSMEICRYEIEIVAFPPEIVDLRRLMLEALTHEVRRHTSRLYGDISDALQHDHLAQRAHQQFHQAAAAIGLSLPDSISDGPEVA